MRDNILLDKSFAFADQIVKVCRSIATEKKELTLSNQMLRSGTSIYANLMESVAAQSKADFLAKLSISYKEASETSGWLKLLHSNNYIDDATFNSMYDACMEIIRILAASTNTLKKQINKKTDES